MDIHEATSVSFPYVPQQRQGDNSAEPDVDDMFSLPTVLDESENVSATVLPTYVSNKSDNMPSVRLYEGDFGVFMTMFEKREAKLNLMGSAMSSIAQEVHNIGTMVGSLETGVQSLLQFPPLPTQRDINKRSSHSTCARVCPINQPADISLAAVPTTAGNSDETEAKTTDDCTTNDHHAQTAGPLSQGTDWATLVSTPLIHSNRIEVSAVGLTDEERSDGGNVCEQRSARVRLYRLSSSLQKRRQNQQQ